MPRLSVVVPAFNEAPIVPELVARLRAVLGPLEPDYEVILVDDGSRDATWPAIVEAGRADPRIRGLELSRNFGQHCAITAGLDRCDGDWVVVMDGDLQDQPEEIPRLVAKAGEGFDVVLARRTGRRDPAPKRLASWLFYRVFNYFTGRRYDGRVGNFRIMSRQVVENLRTMREQLRFLGGMIDWMGFRQGAIDVRHAERPSGRGAYSFARLWHLAQEIIIAYSDKPLRLAIRLGFLISLVAFVYGVFIVIQALRHGIGVAGWPSLIVSVYFLGGIIISILGIIGIYLGRTFAEAKRRPLYVIRSRSNPKD